MRSLSSADDFEQLDLEIARLAQLLTDLKQLRRGRAPNADVLEMSPVIEGWSFVKRRVPCLTGIFFDHPTIDEGEVGYTSEVMVIDTDRGFARTRSRYYTLGAKFEDLASSSNSER